MRRRPALSAARRRESDLRIGAAQTDQAVRRSRARYIASVPCRCGHSWTSGPSPRSGTPGSSGRASTSSAAARCRLQHVVDHRPGLGRVRGAGRVADDPADPDGAQRRAQQVALERAEAGDVLGPAPPAGLGAAAQRARARCRARRPAPGRSCPARQAGRVPSAVITWYGPGLPASARATSRARCGCFSEATSAAPRCAASAASSAALPPGPAQPSSQRAVAARPAGRRPGRARPAGCPRPARRRGPRAPPPERAGSPPSASRTA